MKRDWLDVIIKRDGGQVCFYCKISLSLSEIIWEHLDDNRTHNVIDNLVFACRRCNNKKPHDIDMQIIAQEKLQENIKSNYMREIINSKNKQTSEIEIGTTNFDGNYIVSKIVDFNVFRIANTTTGNEQAGRVVTRNLFYSKSIDNPTEFDLVVPYIGLDGDREFKENDLVKEVIDFIAKDKKRPICSPQN